MLRFFIDILFPSVCVICGDEGDAVCLRCLEAVKKDGFFTLNNDGSALDGLISVCVYHDKSLIAKIIHCFKYEFIKDLSVFLGSLMSETLKKRNLGGDILLCPVPLHRKREKWRGYNQSRFLACEIGNDLGIEVKELLTRIKYKRPQMELGQEERLTNINDAFRLSEMDIGTLSNRTIILVDDVHTTGATMNECAKVLKEAGFRLVYGLVIAQTV